MSGPDTTGPPSGPRIDRVMAHVDAAIDLVFGRMIAARDRAAVADALTSISDLRIAHAIARSHDPAHLDRNGHVIGSPTGWSADRDLGHELPDASHYGYYLGDPRRVAR